MPVELPLRDPVAQFTVLVTAALVVQLTVQRARLPGLLGLLLIGMLLGPGGAGVLPREPVVGMLGAIGLVYVMFIAGLEIDLQSARRHRAEVVTFGVLAFACSALPAFVAGLLLGFALPAAVLLGALLASHTLIAYPLLRRKGLHHLLPVNTAVGGTLLTDTLALVVLAVVLSVAGGGAPGAAALLPLLLLAALAALALWSVPRLSRAVFRRGWITPAEKALFALVVLLLLASAAELIGTEEILGAFLAGICLNRSMAEREYLREHLEFVGRMLFVPFFFIWTGTLVDVNVLLGSTTVWALAGLLLAIVTAGKLSAAWITGRTYGYPPRARLLIAGLTLPQAAATLAVAITAYENGLFDAVVVDAVVLVIFFTCVIGPLVTDQAGRGLAEQPESARSGAAPQRRIDSITAPQQ